MPVVYITGASTGIGAALARELHARGWSVGLIARRADLLESLAQELGERVAWAAADVTRFDAVRDAVGALEKVLGPCDLMVANAGLGGGGHAAKVDPEHELRIVRVNLDGVVHSVAAVLPGMLARGRGHVAAVSSLAGFRGLPMSGAYSASKAAVSALMESYRLDLAPKGVAVTTIHPGFVDTPMTAPNRFPMPFLMPVERAARVVADGLARRRSEINFPWQLVLVVKLLRFLPNFLYDRLLRSARKR